MDFQSSSTCKGGICCHVYRSTATTIHTKAWGAPRDPSTILFIYIVFHAPAAASIFNSGRTNTISTITKGNR